MNKQAHDVGGKVMLILDVWHGEQGHRQQNVQGLLGLNLLVNVFQNFC